MRCESLLGFIRQSPMAAAVRPACPSCNADSWTVLETLTTLVGGPEGINHETRWCVCLCGAQFEVHSKAKVQWVTDSHGRVYAGVPSCFESYILTCIACGGDVKRRYTDLSGTALVSSLCTTIDKGKSIKQYRVFWKCLKCNKELETDYDHWSPL